MMFEHVREPDLFQAVRAVLLKDWDPIGVRAYLTTDYEAIYDEYDRYVPDLVKIIISGGSLQDIEKFLLRAEKEQVPGLRPSNRSSKAAAILFSIGRST